MRNNHASPEGSLSADRAVLKALLMQMYRQGERVAQGREPLSLEGEPCRRLYLDIMGVPSDG